MPQVIITDRDTAQMNSIATVFPTSSALLCKYHITKNVRSQVKPAVGTKQVKDEDEKIVKLGVVVENIMDVWNYIINYSSKELYAESFLHFRILCAIYPYLMKYVKDTILDQVKEKIVCAWTNQVRHFSNTTINRVEYAHAILKNLLGNNKCDFCRDWDVVNQMLRNQHNKIHTYFGRSITMLEHQFKDNILYSQLVGNVSRAALNFIFHEAKRADKTGSNSSKCGCTLRKTNILSCVCLISKKMKLEKPLPIDEVCTHWKWLHFDDDDDGVMKDDKSNTSIMTGWEVIQERFMKVDDIMKFHIKEQLRKISYPETRDLKPLSELVKTKGSPKKVKPTQSGNSTRCTPSYFEHIDSHFLHSLTPKSQKSVYKGSLISKSYSLPPLSKIIHIEEMLLFMHKNIEQIINVEGNDDCGFRVVSGLFGKGEDDYQFVHRHLIQEMKTYRESYTKLYGNKANYDAILNAPVPCLMGPTPFEK